MNRSGVRKESAPAKRDILFTTNPVVAVGVRVAHTGLTSDANGNRVIKAGQPLGGTTNPLVDRQTELVYTQTGNIYGVTQHDIVFQGEESLANANLIIFGFVDLDKMEPSAAETINTNVQNALDKKVTFVRGGKQTTA